MTRDPRRLADTPFDVLVIGAGIYGASIAWDAALRGFSVALVDRGDFGGGASANSLKTVHGGLRSLQRGAIPEMRAFIRERRTLMRIAPHLVHPLTFVIPTEPHPLRSRAALAVALKVTDLIGRDRNDGLPASHRLHGGTLLGRDRTLAHAPDLDPDGVTGGASWCDAQMHNSERLTLAFVQSAERAGAVCVNHLEVVGLSRARGRVTGARVRDLPSDSTFDIRARAVVNAAGAWAPAVTATAFDGQPPAAARPAFSRAMNVVIRRTGGLVAVGGRSEGRFFFRVPWREFTIYGTAHAPFAGAAGDARPGSDDVARFLSDVNRAFPRGPVNPAEVTLVHWGLLPAANHGPHADLARQSVVRNHDRDGTPGLITVIGVRYTTARATAEAAVNEVERTLDRVGRPCATARTPLFGGEFTDPESLRHNVAQAEPGLSPPEIDRVTRAYGSEVGRVLDLWRTSACGRTPLGPRCAVTRAELVLAVRDEAALTLGDALLRRTDAASAGHPGDDVVAAALDVLAPLLGWDPARCARESAALHEHYALRGSSG